MKPSKRYEVLTNYGFNQFIPVALIQFCFIVIYILLKSYKKILLGTLAGDPYVAPAIDTWATVPMILLFLGGYLKLANHLRREQLFYLSLSVVVCPLAVLTFWIYPNGEFLSMKSETVQIIREQYPHMQFLIIWIGRWVETLMCGFATLWGPVFVYMFIWQFANDITNLVKARFFYPVLVFLGGVPYVVGQSIVARSVPDGIVDADQIASILQRYMVITLALSAAAAYIYWHYHQKAKQENKYLPVQVPQKLYVMQSLNHAFSDAFTLRLIILSFGMAFILEVMSTLLSNLTAVTHVEFLQMAEFMDSLTGWIGAMGKLTIVFVLAAIYRLRRTYWSGLSSMTGAAMSCLVVALYVFDYMGYLLKDQMIFSVPMGVAVVATILVLTEGTKFYWYIPAREMFFLTMSQEHRIKSKAIADLLGISAGLTFARIVIAGTTALGNDDFFLGLPYLMGITILVAIAWLKSIVDLRGHMSKSEREPHQILD
ncbi:MAG: hypothetical protein H6849_01440 [Alphaproteobacteria bacterium]|nr:MAG: hypothetical protein H6849_01440 [Alphaproteobacteria bacterium]